MKICVTCGTQCDDKAAFCKNCGSPINENLNTYRPSAISDKVHNDKQADSNALKPDKTNGNNKEKKKKKSKAKIILISILVGVVVLAIGLTVLFFTSDAYSVYTDMKSEDFEDALSDYRDDVKGNFIQETLLGMLLKDRVNEVYEGYQAGEIDYDTATVELDALDQMGFEGAKEKKDLIVVANDAVNALAKADEYYAKGDYENAITEYSKIPKNDENYVTAQEKLNKTYKEYITHVVSISKENNENGEYKESISNINKAYGILPDSIDRSELDIIKKESLTAYKTQLTSEVDEFVENEEYSEAFALIDDAIAFDDDEYFLELKNSTQEKYVDFVTTKVDKYLKDEDYVSAKRVAENSLTVLPGNTDLEAVKKKVEKATPTFLLDVCKPYSTGNYYTEYVNGETSKIGGDTYTNGFSLEGDSNAVFNISAEYSSMNFLVGHCDESDKFSAVIKIYCDDILKKEIKMDPTDLPIKVSIDVTGVKQVKFVQDSDGSWDGTYGYMNLSVK